MRDIVRGVLCKAIGPRPDSEFLALLYDLFPAPLTRDLIDNPECFTGWPADRGCDLLSALSEDFAVVDGWELLRRFEAAVRAMKWLGGWSPISFPPYSIETIARFRAEVEAELAALAPEEGRYRVAAAVVSEALQSIRPHVAVVVNLNWDSLLEKALDSDHWQAADRQPGMTIWRHGSGAGQATARIYRPHGGVHVGRDGRFDFKNSRPCCLWSDIDPKPRTVRWSAQSLLGLYRDVCRCRSLHLCGWSGETEDGHLAFLLRRGWRSARATLNELDRVHVVNTSSPAIARLIASIAVPNEVTPWQQSITAHLRWVIARATESRGALGTSGSGRRPVRRAGGRG